MRPSQRTKGAGWNRLLSSEMRLLQMGLLKMGDGSLVILQYIKLVLGRPNVMPTLVAIHLTFHYLSCKKMMFWR